MSTKKPPTKRRSLTGRLPSGVGEAFQIKVPVLELILRATLIYWFLFLLFRFVLRRDAGAIGLADILVVVLIADAAQNGMAGDSRTLPEGFITIGTIAVWNYWIDWMAFRYPAFARFASPPATLLIKHGRLVRANLKHEMMTVEDLMSQLRLHGVDDIKQVKRACVEPDGHLSVIRSGSSEDPGPSRSPLS